MKSMLACRYYMFSCPCVLPFLTHLLFRRASFVDCQWGWCAALRLSFGVLRPSTRLGFKCRLNWHSFAHPCQWVCASVPVCQCVRVCQCGLAGVCVFYNFSISLLAHCIHISASCCGTLPSLLLFTLSCALCSLFLSFA